MSGAQGTDWAGARADLFRRAACRPEDVEGVGELALRLFGPDGLQYAESDQLAPWRLTQERRQIVVSVHLDDEHLCVAVARALAFWWLTLDTETAPTSDDVASLGAAIAVPLGALALAVDEDGDDIDDLARRFVVPPDVIRERLRCLPGRPAFTPSANRGDANVIAFADASARIRARRAAERRCAP